MRALRAAKKLLIEDDDFGAQREATLVVDGEHATVVAPQAPPASDDATATDRSVDSPASGTLAEVLVADATPFVSARADEPTRFAGDAASKPRELELAERSGSSPQVAAEAAMQRPALCGHSSVLAVPEVLGLLATLSKSGAFSVWNEQDAFRIRLVRGTVVSAQATSATHRLLLGRILVDHGSLTEEALARFVDSWPEPKRRLGDALIEAGLIDRAALESAIQFQAQRVFHAAYDLRDAWYRFDPERDDGAQEHGLSVTHLLLESARMRDETEQRLDDVLGDPFDEPRG
jgi:hypothetical protein